MVVTPLRLALALLEVPPEEEGQEPSVAIGLEGSSYTAVPFRTVCHRGLKDSRKPIAMGHNQKG